MASIKSMHTKPEILLRKTVFSLGYRYRLHVKGLPGKPDVVFPRQKKVIFVHGCFWHAHKCKKPPASNQEYWNQKLLTNKKRDRKNSAALKRRGWKILVIWECELKKMDKTVAKLLKFLED